MEVQRLMQGPGSVSRSHATELNAKDKHWGVVFTSFNPRTSRWLTGSLDKRHSCLGYEAMRRSRQKRRTGRGGEEGWEEERRALGDRKVRAEGGGELVRRCKGYLHTWAVLGI
ncbi:hypothetical protein E2C01_035908 [Portunus trituberculatus]|uniref:Uncharacterized protein n=1 Tax=Portunus trituberculatus TaxID=210409 RepID=A0A5B7FAK1_PORTR|nr:hypothetical protein [Portunus trituberculatus]